MDDRSFRLGDHGRSPTENSMRLSIIIVAALSVISGCGEHGPLDNATLDTLSRTGMHGADVTYPDGYEAALPAEDYDKMRNLISALAPVRTAVEGTLEEYDYRLVYIAGMDPAVIDVKLEDDNQFTYKWGRYVYTGGKPARFVDGVNAIRARVATLRGERQSTDVSGEPSDAPKDRASRIDNGKHNAGPR